MKCQSENKEARSAYHYEVLALMERAERNKAHELLNNVHKRMQ